MSSMSLWRAQRRPSMASYMSGVPKLADVSSETLLLEAWAHHHPAAVCICAVLWALLEQAFTYM